MVAFGQNCGIMRKPAKRLTSQVFYSFKTERVFQMRGYSIVHGAKIATEFTPETFGRLTTLGPKFLLMLSKAGKRRAYQVCECRRGEVLVVNATSLSTGHTGSCGCINKDKPPRTTHGMIKTTEYRSWSEMRSRCDNRKRPRYKTHGARGITYCERWKKFENFFADMGRKPSPEHTLDRFPDNNGNYEPSNCRWATVTEQNNNRRSNLMITIGDKTDTLANWCRRNAIAYETARARLQAGWEPETALITPVKKKVRKQ